MIAARRRRTQAASSYLEVMLAMVILALCIVPASRMLPTLLASQRGLETRFQLSLIAQGKLEAAVLGLGANFGPSLEHGTLSAEGRPTWNYDILVETLTLGLGRDATVRARAWVDLDGGIDFVPDPEDPQVRFDTLVANPRRSP